MSHSGRNWSPPSSEYCWAFRLGYFFRNERAKQLRQALRNTLDHNSQLMSQLATDFGPTNLQFVPTYRLDRSLLEATSFEAFQILSSVEAAAALARARYELAHLDAKLDLLGNLFPGHVHTPGSGHAVRALRESCLAHIPLVQRAIAEARTSIDEQ